jgi:hypothetical protein
MTAGLTFEQVKQARVFAWHALHYVFANDTLLRVVLPVNLDSDPEAWNRAPMTIRPSSLRGSEHLLDAGWHHLDNCTCRFCSAHQDEASHSAENCGCCGRPTP